eukprot:11431679-Karenia_brevis.AAC.1
MPTRCLPMIYMDANSKMGMQIVHGQACYIESHLHGGENVGVENVSGRVLREFFEKYLIQLPHTFKALPDTFYGGQGRSTFIDFIGVPAAMWQNQSLQMRPYVWLRSGRR